MPDSPMAKKLKNARLALAKAEHAGRPETELAVLRRKLAAVENEKKIRAGVHRG